MQNEISDELLAKLQALPETETGYATCPTCGGKMLHEGMCGFDLEIGEEKVFRWYYGACRNPSCATYAKWKRAIRSRKDWDIAEAARKRRQEERDRDPYYHGKRRVFD